MHFRPHPSPDRWRALGAVLGALLFGLLLLRIATTRPVDGLSFVLALLPLAALPAIGYLAYRTLGVFTMEYWVDRDAVTFVWGPTQHVVPIREIKRIQRGAKTESVHGKSWLHWPCEHCRQVIGKNIGRVHCYATRPLDEQIILVTDTDSYGLSPADPEGFLQQLQKRYRAWRGGLALWKSAAHPSGGGHCGETGPLCC